MSLILDEEGGEQDEHFFEENFSSGLRQVSPLDCKIVQ